MHYLRGDYDAAYAEFRRELEYVSTSDHALRERTLIELHQKLSAVHHARGEDAEAARFGDLAIQAHARRVAAGADDPATRYYVAAVYARRGDVEHTREHLALPLSRLPQFTRWRLRARHRLRSRPRPADVVERTRQRAVSAAAEAAALQGRYDRWPTATSDKPIGGEISRSSGNAHGATSVSNSFTCVRLCAVDLLMCALYIHPTRPIGLV